MKECDRKLWEAAQAYYLARIEKEQPNPDPRLLQALGEVTVELTQVIEGGIHDTSIS